MEGRLVKQEYIGEMFDGFVKEFDISEFATGVYFVRLTAGSKTITSRIILE